MLFLIVRAANKSIHLNMETAVPHFWGCGVCRFNRKGDKVLTCKGEPAMYNEIEEWINSVLEQDIPPETAAFCFNLYEDEGNTWSMELVGTQQFDLDDSDWACKFSFFFVQ